MKHGMLKLGCQLKATGSAPALKLQNKRRYMGCIWVVYGLYMGCIWVVYGLYMGCIWVVYGLYMGCIWIHSPKQQQESTYSSTSCELDPENGVKPLHKSRTFSCWKLGNDESFSRRHAQMIGRNHGCCLGSCFQIK